MVGFSRTETTLETLFEGRVIVQRVGENGGINRQNFCWRRCDIGSDSSVRQAMTAALEYLKRNGLRSFDLVLLITIPSDARQTCGTGRI